MPFFDRYWWLRLVGAAIAAMLDLLIFVRLVVPAITLTRVSADTWVAIAFGLALLIVAVLSARSVRPARDHKERRERAIAGDQDAMPRADMPQGWLSSGAASQGHFAVFWHAAWYSRLFAVFLCLIALFTILFFAAFALIPFIRFLVTGDRQISSNAPLLAVVGAMALVSFSLYLLYWMIPAVLGEKPGVEVRREGVFTRQLWGTEQLVRLDEARLLEVSLSPRLSLAPPHRTFRLYGARSVAVWRDGLRPSRDSRLDLFEPDRQDRFHYWDRIEVIAARIEEHTGLAWRTFSPQLMHRRQERS